jgi:hypothetical protein
MRRANFTNDREKLSAALRHDVSYSSAHAPEQEHSFDIGLGL